MAQQQQQPQQLATQQQYQQFPQNYYPDQYQQYQQLLNGSSNSQHAAQLQAGSQVNQPYGSYYMQSNTQQQAGQPQAQLQQSGQQPNPQQQISGQSQTQQASTGSTTQQASGSDQYAHAARYPTGYGAPYNSYSIYQQSVPQNQLSQPQPQHYNQLSNASAGSTGTAAAAYSTGNTSTNTPIQADTLNSASNSTVGQYQPPGIRPRVTTTMWEDEKTLCYQVDANNVSVVRRADNNMINGTKLLNVAQMTRGRRDGILKSEKVRHVVKIGSMHLKGVWIPFERALAMAQREGIVDLLYPLFVRDIKRVIQTGVTPNSNANAVGAKQTPHLSGGNNGTPLAGQQGNAGLNNNNVNLSNYYQQYSSQYPQANGATTTQTNQSPLHINSAIGGTQESSVPQQQGQGQTQQQQSPQQPQQQQSQVYGYQQPYYATAPNQYYQPYGPNANYSSYGGQPVYPGYGYVNQQQVPQSVPQSVQPSLAAAKAARPQGATASSGSAAELSGASTDATSGTAGDASVKREGLIKK